MPEISLTIAVFYAGSIVMGLTGSRFIERVHIHHALLATIAVQSLISAATLLVTDLPLLLVLRFAQGAAMGILRPVNQIWLLEFERADSAEESAQRQIFSQVGLGIGLAAGGYIGAVVGGVGDAFLTVAACILPALVTLAITPAPRERPVALTPTVAGSASVKNDIAGAFKWLVRSRYAWAGVAAFCVSMAVFKIWIVAYPYAARMVEGSDSSSLLSLTVVLAVQPLFFTAAQWVFGKNIRRIRIGSVVGLRLLLVCAVSQAVLTWIAIAAAGAWWPPLLIIIGGGLAAAFIYPLMSMLVLREMATEVTHRQRQTMIVLAVAADVGQIMGALLLGVPAITSIPAEAMAIPVVVLLGIGLLAYWRTAPTALAERGPRPSA